jgi:Ca2+-binding EF-hand superfamily protein
MAESFLLREVSRDYGLPLEDMLIPAYRVFKDVAEVPEYISAFASIMRDGLLYKAGFATLLRKLAGNNADDIQMDLAINSAYQNNDGSDVESLRFAEFACWLNAHAFDEFISTEEAAERLQNRDICMEFGLNLVEVENYRSDFKRFDLDQTGVISKSEFAAMLSSLTKMKLNDIPTSRVNMWWQSADMDRNGSICFKEFIVFHQKFFHSDGMGGTYIADDFYAFAGPAGARISRFNY